LVFLELKRRHLRCFFYKRKNECDFVIHDKDRIIAAIQVTWVLTDKDVEREYDGLLEALQEYHLDEGLILTYDTYEEKGQQIKGKIVYIKPVWLWLLQDTN
jgi:predicted AAA+ superfamily ATPase